MEFLEAIIWAIMTVASGQAARHCSVRFPRRAGALLGSTGGERFISLVPA